MEKKDEGDINMKFPDTWGVKGRGSFPNNLVKMTGEKEIARSILNNGFLTIAHNWSSDDRDAFKSLFIKLGASKKFLSGIDNMFNYLVDYEDPRTSINYKFTDYDEEISEGAWENMVAQASSLDSQARKEKLYEKLAKMINW